MSNELPQRAGLRVTALSRPQLPQWARTLFRDAKTQSIAEIDGGTRIDLARANELALLEALVPRATELDAADLHEALECCYRQLLTEMRARGLTPLRFWNYLPEIGRRRDRGASTYEIFNSARLATYRDEHADTELAARIPAASAVGIRNDDIQIHALAAERSGRAVANPRQSQPHDYSRAYGAVPPAFARALVIDPRMRAAAGCPDAILSGTASIVGEESRHPNDLRAQLDEIARNLVALVAALDPDPAVASFSPDFPDASEQLKQVSAIRAYVPDSRKQASIVDWIEACFPQLDTAEIVSADLCRPDLLVEIEGTVAFAASSTAPLGASTASL